MPHPSPYWEPWTPAVGQRVRVRLGGECAVDWGPRSLPARYGQRTGHPPQFDGVTGTVRRVLADADRFLGHTVSVEFDAPVDIGRLGRLRGGDFAPAELEPLTPGAD